MADAPAMAIPAMYHHNRLPSQINVAIATSATEGVASAAHAIRNPEAASAHRRWLATQIAIEASAKALLSQRCCAVSMRGSAIWKARNRSAVMTAVARDAKRSTSQ